MVMILTRTITVIEGVYFCGDDFNQDFLLRLFPSSGTLYTPLEGVYIVVVTFTANWNFSFESKHNEPFDEGRVFWLICCN